MYDANIMQDHYGICLEVVTTIIIDLKASRIGNHSSLQLHLQYSKVN
jgi:hypothetical protein